MKYRYFICDVFTETRFGGNQLAVLPHAEGLTDRQMQQIAREFNFSETTFVLPPETGGTRRVRIFTPGAEVPFAGHPNVGTAFVLATTGELGGIRSSLEVTFEELAGPVPITIREADGRITSCELKAPQPITIGKTVPAALAARAASLETGDIRTETHAPVAASVGLPFLMTEVRDRNALERARIDAAGFDALVAEGAPFLHLYARVADGFDIRARMFAPTAGVPEDPATGSANCALAGLLAHLDHRADGAFEYRIAQGVEMGRPSVLHARAAKRAGDVHATWIGGASVMVSEGTLLLD